VPAGAAGVGSAEGGGLNYAQIAPIVVTANQVDIDAGKLAKAKGHAKEVRDFAQRMVTAHTGVDKSATELVQKLPVTPQANPTSENLQRGGAQSLAHLRKLDWSFTPRKAGSYP
jgi:putative membrane protein